MKILKYITGLIGNIFRAPKADLILFTIAAFFILFFIWASRSELEEVTRGNGKVIALQGPMGNGKTTLIKDGLSKALNKPFYFIGLGGATNASFLNGHSYTWEGSKPGIIVQALQKNKVMDGILYFDELDKISKTDSGNEISNCLWNPNICILFVNMVSNIFLYFDKFFQ